MKKFVILSLLMFLTLSRTLYATDVAISSGDGTWFAAQPYYSENKSLLDGGWALIPAGQYVEHFPATIEPFTSAKNFINFHDVMPKDVNRYFKKPFCGHYEDHCDQLYLIFFKLKDEQLQTCKIKLVQQANTGKLFVKEQQGNCHMDKESSKPGSINLILE